MVMSCKLKFYLNGCYLYASQIRYSSTSLPPNDWLKVRLDKRLRQDVKRVDCWDTREYLLAVSGVSTHLDEEAELNLRWLYWKTRGFHLWKLCIMTAYHYQTEHSACPLFLSLHYSIRVVWLLIIIYRDGLLVVRLHTIVKQVVVMHIVVEQVIVM